LNLTDASSDSQPGDESEALEAEVRRLTAELAQARAQAQRLSQEAAVLQPSAPWSFLPGGSRVWLEADSNNQLQVLHVRIGLSKYHRWRRRLLPPGSRRERVYRKLRSVLSRRLGRPRAAEEADPAAQPWAAPEGTAAAPVAVDAPPPPPREEGSEPVFTRVRAAKEYLTRLRQSEVAVFLATGRRLRFPHHEQPLVSVVIVVHNRADLTFQCLRGLAENVDVPFELIVVDNASSDETADLFDRVEPVVVIRNDANLHFLLACNQAAPRARGQYLLFLNSDIALLPGSLAAAVRTMRSSPDVGAVGGKLVLLDGTLQEAGSIVWQDGSALGYGRGDSPLAPPYMFQRDVDYCSGAFLLTPRELFLGGGGFDERFAPAYYEEVDYCMRLREQGKRIVYDPEVVAFHFEFGSSASSKAAIVLQQLNHAKFAEKHRRALASHCPPDPRHVLAARHARKDGRRVLMIEDRVPHQFLGSGFPRARAILQCMVDRGYRVAFYPMTVARESWPSVYQDIPRTVEVITGSGVGGLEAFLHERRGLYDVITISRPHNMEHFGRVWSAHPDWLAGVRVVYDAEAVFALREISRSHLLGRALPASEAERLVAKEIDLARRADAVVCVTEGEAAQYRRRGISNVFVLGHALDADPTTADFADREHLLFVGAIHEDNSPNADSVLWFTDQVLPRIRDVLGGVELYVAGLNVSSAVAGLAGRGVRLLGPVADLRPLYQSRRLFVAPTRFAAGVPIKVCEAAAYGLPVVATPLLASQLGWRPGQDLLVGDTAEAFARACIEAYRDRATWERLRANALKQVKTQCSRAEFARIVARLCDEGPPIATPGGLPPLGVASAGPSL
jgi:O-antigen biosynthesis protein